MTADRQCPGSCSWEAPHAGPCPEDPPDCRDCGAAWQPGVRCCVVALHAARADLERVAAERDEARETSRRHELAHGEVQGLALLYLARAEAAEGSLRGVTAQREGALRSLKSAIGELREARDEIARLTQANGAEQHLALRYLGRAERAEAALRETGVSPFLDAQAGMTCYECLWCAAHEHDGRPVVEHVPGCRLVALGLGTTPAKASNEKGNG